MTKFEQIDISQKVMRQIHDREIKMRPRWYFVLRRILFYTAVILAFALSIFFVNLVIFKFRIYDPLGYFWFGLQGLKAAMGSANWELIIFALFSTIAFFLVLKTSPFWYKHKPAPLIASFLVLIAVSAFAFDKTGINDKVRSSQKFPSLYAGEYADEYWVMGKVVGANLKERSMYVLTPDNEMAFVTWEQSTMLPNGSVFKTGDTVQVVGSLSKSVFKAQGITIR